MEITKQDWEEAAAILDTAHDVLLHTGVQCADTGEHDPSKEENCTWEAIAIAMGRYDGLNRPDWQYTYDKCCGYAGSSSNVERLVGRAMGDFSPGTNDCSTADEVFDRIREGAKYAREQAGALVS